MNILLLGLNFLGKPQHLTIAALSARGSSQIWGLEHVDRGYEALERDLAALGGQISRRQGEADCRPGAEGETGACL